MDNDKKVHAEILEEIAFNLQSENAALQHDCNVLQKICAERSDELENMRLINREQEQRLINETFLLTEEKQFKAIHAADILSIKNLVRECDGYKIRLSQAQESINYWMVVADEARAQVTIARIQEREACAQVCENGKGFDGDHPHDVFAAAIRARSSEMRKADFISSTPLREGWVSVPRELLETLQSIYVAGNFVIETHNEQILSDLMTKLGYPVIAAKEGK